MTNSRSSSPSPLFLILAAICLHSALASSQATIRRDIFHDEAITLQAITGHEAKYIEVAGSESPPHGAWVPARDWQDLLAMPKTAAPEYGVIAKDLAAHDIHPPLYFWLFSFVARVLGTSKTVGLGLNVALDALTVLATYFLGKRVLQNKQAGAIAACLWTIAPGPLEACLEMRQYALLGLLVTTFALIFVQSFSSKYAGPLAIAAMVVCALGTLTHYHFLLAVFAFVMVTLISFGEPNHPWLNEKPWARPLRSLIAFVTPNETAESSTQARRNGLLFIAGSIVGTILGLGAHPYIFSILHRQGSQAQSPKIADIPVRIGGVLVGMGRFFVSSVPLIVLWMIVLVVGIIFLMRAPKKTIVNHVLSFDVPLRRTILALLILFGLQVGLFLSFRSPAGAMRAKYLVLDYSLFACVVAGILASLVSSPKIARIILGTMVASSIIALGLEVRHAAQIEASIPRIVAAPRIMFDTVARGSLPVALWNVPEDKLVYAANLNEIMAKQDSLLSNLEGGTLIVVDPERSNATVRATMFAFLSQRYRVETIKLAAFSERIVYELHENAAHSTK